MALATEDRVTEVVRENAASLLRLARAHSLCEDDAADAYQRTMEIYLERVDRLQHATVAAWLRTVCKHEAMRLRNARARLLSDPVEWDERPSAEAVDLAERAASSERVARAAEALQACAPQEAQAILLRASGASYAEIGAQTGWSYSKVNRLLAGGRARFLSGFARIESGEACARHLPVLSAIVDGEATPDDFLAVRPHLRHCAGCRATLRALYEAEPAVGALVPAGALVLAAPEGSGLFARAYESLAEQLVRAHGLVETVSAGKAAAVLASAGAVAAGGTAVARHHAPPARPIVRAAVQTASPTPEPTAAPTETPPPVATPAPVATEPPATPTASPAPTAAATPAATPTADAFAGPETEPPPSHAPPQPLSIERAPPRSAAPRARKPAATAADGFGPEG